VSRANKQSAAALKTRHCGGEAFVDSVPAPCQAALILESMIGKKPALGLDPRVDAGFPKRSRSNEKTRP
jgi:hypothetical protein